MKNISWGVSWTASQMMQLTTEMWTEEQIYGKERTTSATDKFYRSKISQEGCPGGM